MRGAFAYGSDLWADGALWGRTVRSPHPHARIRLDRRRPCPRDPGRACGAPGRRRARASDCTGWSSPISRCWRRGSSATSGEPVAVVAADHPETARRAAASVRVSYEGSTPITDMERSTAPDAPLLHAWGNVLRHIHIEHGDPDAQADIVGPGLLRDGHAGPGGARTRGRTRGAGRGRRDRPLRHDPMAARRPAPDRAVPRTCPRSVFACTSPGSAARSDPGKTCTCTSTRACSPCTRIGPVKMVYDRAESFLGHVHRHPARIWMRHGATRDGQPRERAGAAADRRGRLRLVVDRGDRERLHRSRAGPTTCRTPRSTAPPSPRTTLRAERCAGSARRRCASDTRRRWTSSRACWAIDPIELRLRNALRPGSVLPTGSGAAIERPGRGADPSVRGDPRAAGRIHGSRSCSSCRAAQAMSVSAKACAGASGSPWATRTSPTARGSTIPRKRRVTLSWAAVPWPRCAPPRSRSGRDC